MSTATLVMPRGGRDDASSRNIPASSSINGSMKGRFPDNSLSSLKSTSRKRLRTRKTLLSGYMIPAEIRLGLSQGTTDKLSISAVLNVIKRIMGRSSASATCVVSARFTETMKLFVPETTCFYQSINALTAMERQIEKVPLLFSVYRG